MKYRVMPGSVTVNGPPSAISFDQMSSTLPADPSTLPKRTIEKLTGDR